MTSSSCFTLVALFFWTHLLPCQASTVISSVKDLFESNTRYESLVYRFPGEADQDDEDIPTDANLNDTLANRTQLGSVSIGKDMADITEFPHLVAIQARFPGFSTGFTSWFFICGGSLVARDKILTAAHCVEGSETGVQFRVLLGTNNFKLTPEAQVISVSKVISHPKYMGAGFFQRRGFYANDIAVLLLEKKAVLSDKVQIIELADDDDDEDLVGKKCKIAGYGATDSVTFQNSPIHSAEVTVLSVRECQNIINQQFKNVIYIRRLHVCTLDEGVSPCFGDSGSALVCNGKAVGVFSFVNNRCSGSNFPVGYMRVSWYEDYLEYLLEEDW